MSGIHHFVPVLHRGDAVGRHTLRLRDGQSDAWLRLRHLRGHHRGGHRVGDRAGPLVSRGGPARRHRRVPVRHGVRHGRLAGLADRNPRGQLPQHHAAGTDGPLGQPSGAGPAPGAGGSAAPGTARQAGHRRFRLQRGPPGRGGFRRHRGGPAVRRTADRSAGGGRVTRRRAHHGGTALVGWPSAASRRTRPSSAPWPPSPWPASTTTPGRRCG